MVTVSIIVVIIITTEVINAQTKNSCHVLIQNPPFQYCALTSVTAKVRNLHDHQLRLLHSIVPVPSGCDVANTLKYFTTTLLSEFSLCQPH